MELTGEQTILAPREQVWTALNDPEILKRCIPGCQDIQKVSDTELTAKVGLAVGPVKATFNGRVTLSDLDPPNGYKISGEGQGGVALTRAQFDALVLGLPWQWLGDGGVIRTL